MHSQVNFCTLHDRLVVCIFFRLVSCLHGLNEHGMADNINEDINLNAS